MLAIPTPRGCQLLHPSPDPETHRARPPGRRCWTLMESLPVVADLDHHHHTHTSSADGSPTVPHRRPDLLGGDAATARGNGPLRSPPGCPPRRGIFDSLPILAKSYLKEGPSRIDELPHVVHILTSKDRKGKIQFLKEQSDLIEDVIDEVMHAYHHDFHKAIQIYSLVSS